MFGNWRKATKLARAVAALTSFALVSACNRPDGRWVVERIDGRLAAGPGLTHVGFLDGRVSAHAAGGCNSLSGNYRVASGRLDLSQVGQTIKICSPDRLGRDMELFVHFTAPLRFQRLKGGGLVLMGDGRRSLLLRPFEAVGAVTPVTGRSRLP
jgi:heat shock protein HslJ